MTCTLAMAAIYTTTVGGNTGNYCSAQMWIDFSNNGIFETSETVGGQANFVSGRARPNITIPSSGITPGAYRMRVIVSYSANNAPGANPNYPTYPQIPPCPTSTVQYCDTRDYRVTIIPPIPLLTTTPTSLPFGYVTSGTSSAPQTYSMSGLYLTPGGTITVSAPANFEVSNNGTTWVSSYGVTYSGSTLSATTVYVRFNPTAISAYSANVGMSGGGLLSTVNVAVTGNGAAACSGTPSAGTAVVSPIYGSTSTPFTITLSGYSLSGGLTFQSGRV
jgi:hypothetical protein